MVSAGFPPEAPCLPGRNHPEFLRHCLRGGRDGDHVHLLIGLKPMDVIPDLIRVVKAESSKWIKGELNRTAFAWQDGYGVFSVSASGLEAVRGYVLGAGRASSHPDIPGGVSGDVEKKRGGV